MGSVESLSLKNNGDVIGQVDAKTTALAMAITDSELSDEEASILESGGFSVSRATTPQLTDVCEGRCPSTAGPSSKVSVLCNLDSKEKEWCVFISANRSKNVLPHLKQMLA